VSGPAEDRICQLARELEPVRPIPRLRAALATALGLWGAGLAGERLLGGPSLRPGSDAAWFEPAFLAQLGGLVLAALGFTLAALASAVPGREGALRRGLGAGAIGMLAALVGGLWGLPGSPGVSAGEGFAGLAGCGLRALGLGSASTLLGCIFIARAWVRRPAFAAWLALAGGSTLGAVAVHVTCPSNSALHQLLGHALAPLVAAAALALPFSLPLRSRAQSNAG
jgi:hypothetical protein